MILEFLGLSRRSSLENPRVSLFDVEAWQELFGSSSTDSGIAMSHSKALGYGPVWQAVSLISGDVARMPLDVYRRIDDRARERDATHPAYKLVRRRANSEMSAFAFWRRIMVHLLLWNRAYAFIDRNGAGRPLELIPLLPDRTAPVRRKGKLYYVTEVDGRLEPFPAYDVLAFGGIALEGLEPCDLVEKARHAFALGLAAERFQSRFFKNGAITAGILEVPAGMTKTAADKLEEGFRKQHTSDANWFKTIVLRDGAKFHSTTIPPEAAQMIETRREQVKDVARWYNLPPHKLGDDSRTSYNSLELENQSYLDSGLSPWLETITAECWMKLLSPSEQQNDSHYFEHNTKALLRTDALKRHQIYRIGIDSGIYSPDECRAMENLNPRPDGKGGEYRLPLNMKSASDPEPAAGDEDPPRSPSGNEGEGDDERQRQLDAAQRQLLADAVGRMLRRLALHARRAARSPETYLAWRNDELESHRSVVAAAVGPAIDVLALSRGKEPAAVRQAAIDKLMSHARSTLDRPHDQADAAAAELEASQDELTGVLASL